MFVSKIAVIIWKAILSVNRAFRTNFNYQGGCHKKLLKSGSDLYLELNSLAQLHFLEQVRSMSSVKNI